MFGHMFLCDMNRLQSNQHTSIRPILFWVVTKGIWQKDTKVSKVPEEYICAFNLKT